MSQNLRSIIVGLYGLAVNASGALRYFGQEGGSKGLAFGAVMGTLALTAAFFIRGRREALGRGLALVCTLVVGGWFVWESFFIKGFDQAETRQLVIIGASIICLVVVALPGRSENS